MIKNTRIIIGIKWNYQLHKKRS